jgi:hypothetical protein
MDGGELEVLQAGRGDLFAGAFKANAQGPPIISVYSQVNHAVLLCLPQPKVKAVDLRPGLHQAPKHNST